MEKEEMPINPQAFERNLFDLISSLPGPEHFRLESTDQAKADPAYGVYEKDLPELRKLAAPLARFLLEHGMLHGKVVVSATRVEVYADEAGSAFTEEDKDIIFQELADQAPAYESSGQTQN